MALEVQRNSLELGNLMVVLNFIYAEDLISIQINAYETSHLMYKRNWRNF